jgi:hypothetical protein
MVNESPFFGTPTERTIGRATFAPPKAYAVGPYAPPSEWLDNILYKAAIEANAAEIKRLHSRTHETLQYRHKSPEQTERWKTACAEFHARYDGLAFPGGYSTAKDRIRSGNPDAIEAALCFVELRPYFFRSGYMFKTFISMLKRAQLTADQRERFNRVAVAYAEWRAHKQVQRGA